MAAIKTLERYREFLADFIANGDGLDYLHNDTFRGRGFEVYVRYAWQEVHDDVHLCLDIANVRVYRKRQGTFKRLLAISQELCPWNAVRVECVQNKNLAAYLRRISLEDERWVEDGRPDSPNFTWFRDKVTEYSRPGFAGLETRTTMRARFFEESGSLRSVFAALTAAKRKQLKQRHSLP